MGKCLNCGKEVKNKFCNTSCQNAYRAKQKRLEYEKNPKFCKNCGKALPWEKRRNNYCSSSCAAKINNLTIIRNKKGNSLFKSKMNQISDEEFINVINNNYTWKDICTNLGYTYHAEIKEKIKERCKNLKITLKVKEFINVNNKTKKELFDNRKNWQSARSQIRKEAEKNFNKSNTPHKCFICGYDKCIEIAHIKPVSSFNDSSLISEINDIHNLIPLCPNHHWEFDHNCLSKKDKDKIIKYSGMDQ